MAFFKFRKGADAPAPPPPESIEALRRRARYRLTGAAVLVLAGVIGFPLLFDTQPRPIALDIPIDIPDRNKVKPLGAPASPAALQVPVIADPVIAAAPPTGGTSTASAGQPVSATEARADARTADKADAGGGEGRSGRSEAVARTEAKAARTEPKAESKSDTKPETKSDTKGEAKSDTKGDAKAEAKSDTKGEAKVARAVPRDEAEALKAKALLEAKPVDAAASQASAASPAAGEGRFVVQVGAFADAAKAQDMRMKVERSGLKTYTHVADTKEGKRTRVRVGPFATRGEADKAAAKIKGLDLPASVLTL